MRIRLARTRLLVALAGIFVMASAGLALNGGSSTAQAAIDNTPDCDTVAIIKCGAFSEADLKQAYDKNTYGDLPEVYNAFGISRSDLSGFKNGIVYRNGTVTVDGEVVATDAMTAGRNYGGTPISGTKNVGKYSVSKFVDEGQTAFVKLKGGVFEFAVVKACGNPVTATPKTPPKPKPVYSCDGLETKKISRTDYELTATGSADNGAKITGYRFNFGDNTSLTTTSRTVSHTYKQAGSYPVTVEVRVSVDGDTKYVDGNDCDQKITVTPPPVTPQYACSALTARLTDVSTRTVAYTLGYSASGGAKLTSVDFDFGDGQSAKGIATTDLAGVKHAYARDGSYTTTATLHFTINAKVTDVNCATSLTITPQTCPQNPSLSKDSPDCGVIHVCELATKQIISIKDSAFNSTLHSKDQAACTEPPTTLPSTGPTEFVMGGLGLSSLTAAGYYLRTSRRALINKYLKRS